MPTLSRLHRCAWIAVVGMWLAACARQREPAHELIGHTEALVMAVSSDAATYVPDRLTDVQAKLGDLQAAFDRQDYASVMRDGPAVLSAARGLAGAAAAKRGELTKALSDQWMGLAAVLPEYVTTLQRRVDLLGRNSGGKMAAGVDLEAARASLTGDSSLWSKAQAAFASGNLSEAVTTANDVKTRLEALATTLTVDLSAPGGNRPTAFLR